ncbi:DUF4902 domain-containing protein [Solilutibacter silvestris]|uniref:DUF4902 domain-containing protein n=1 Tax=Solilutibacter silvestris TaxID=1645665 RepID=A0A2K1PZF0_9GAMM|nr:DUF4902 domain-containing protein [Lysobacter silvestris]PNS08163.1 hypothetical protein Lysil_2339 [Lysobacter silvestris]
MMILDQDGYVKLYLRNFRGIRMEHFVSGLEEDAHEKTPMEGASVSTIEGYTEWVSTSVPVISLGWDWIFDPMRIPSMLVRQNSLRTNVMFLDNDGAEVGPFKTAVLLEAVLECFGWQETVLDAIENRYAMHQKTPPLHEANIQLE